MSLLPYSEMADIASTPNDNKSFNDTY